MRAVRRIYQGPRARGVQISGGFAPGSELNWNPWIIGPQALQTQFGTEFFRWIVYESPTWTPAGFHIDRDFADAERRIVV